ncbi:MAG: hypothetical protein IPK73_23440 [Candidatus Obscuribacter sp.]|nr:hypothetical protein [Candidatus Obscuribacter sp.]
MTYESESEARVLKSYWRPGADLENTLFTFLDPYGRQLTPGIRSPGFVFNDPREMALSMDELARRYGATSNKRDNQNLPVVASVRLALNVAAADKQPLAVVVSNSSQERRALEKKLAPLAWKQDLIGRLTYASGSLSELRNIAGIGVAKGYVFVLPDEFGTGGQVLGQLTDTPPRRIWTAPSSTPSTSTNPQPSVTTSTCSSVTDRVSNGLPPYP